MSIFGFEKDTPDTNSSNNNNNLPSRINDMHKKILSLTDLNSRLQRMTIETKDKVENLKSPITISAESKGSLSVGEVFSFGNAGRQKDVGYVVMRRGHIIGISLSSERPSGGPLSEREVRVGVLVNGEVLSGCEITLHTTPRKHYNFDSPFLVEAGSVINFISLRANGIAVNTVAALLFLF